MSLVNVTCLHGDGVVDQKTKSWFLNGSITIRGWSQRFSNNGVVLEGSTTMTFWQRWPQYGGATVKLQPPTTAHHLSSNGREIHSGSGGSRGGEETENAVEERGNGEKGGESGNVTVWEDL